MNARLAQDSVAYASVIQNRKEARKGWVWSAQLPRVQVCGRIRVGRERLCGGDFAGSGRDRSKILGSSSWREHEMKGRGGEERGGGEDRGRDKHSVVYPTHVA